VPNLMETSRMAATGFTYDDREAGRDCKVQKDLLIPQDLDNDGEADAQVLNHSTAYGRVNPFNPCLPYNFSRTCGRVVEFGTTFAPFDGSTDWFALQ